MVLAPGDASDEDRQGRVQEAEIEVIFQMQVFCGLEVHLSPLVFPVQPRRP